MLEEEEISRDVIITRGQDMLSTHWTHMREEEERFFPLCERCLTASDWADIMLEASDRPDPILAGQAAHHLTLLRERILAL